MIEKVKEINDSVSSCSTKPSSRAISNRSTRPMSNFIFEHDENESTFTLKPVNKFDSKLKLPLITNKTSP